MNDNRNQGTNTEAWIQIMKSARRHREVNADQLLKAVRDYPELISSLSLTVGFLAHKLAVAELQNPGDLGIPDPLREIDECFLLPAKLCACIYNGDIEACRELFTPDILPDLPDIIPTPDPCSGLIADYKAADASECLRNIDATLPRDEYLEAIDNCITAQNEAEQALKDADCWCNYLFGELQDAQSKGDVARVQQVLNEMEASNCN